MNVQGLFAPFENDVWEEFVASPEAQGIGVEDLAELRRFRLPNAKPIAVSDYVKQLILVRARRHGTDD